MLLPSLLRGPVEAGTSSKDGDQSRPQLPGGGLVAAGRGKGGGSGRGHCHSVLEGLSCGRGSKLVICGPKGNRHQPKKKESFLTVRAAPR